MRPILTGRARHHQTQNLSDQHPEPVKPPSVAGFEADRQV
jgi:hypothetical protein